MVENESARWFVAGEINHRGPFTQSEIQTQLDAGLVKADTFVWKEGMADWLPAAEALPIDFKEDQPDWAFLLKDAAHMPAIIEEKTAVQAEIAKPRYLFRFSWLAALIIFGALVSWWMTAKSSRAEIRDVANAEAIELNAALEKSRSKDPVAAIAISTTDSSAPSFYIATNHRDGTKLDITLQGVTDTLVDHFQMTAGATVVVEQGMAHTPSFRQTNGQPLAKGEYIVSVSDGEGILAQKTYFIGGVKDQNYEHNLRTYHARLVSQAEGEINELKQLIEVVSHQAHELNSQFQTLAARHGSVKKDWERFLKPWQAMQKQISEPFNKRSDAAYDSELFYGDMYRVLKTVLGRIEAIQQTQSRYLDLGNVDRGLIVEITNEISTLQSDLDALRDRVEAAEVMPTTAKGMPQWPVSNISSSNL